MFIKCQKIPRPKCVTLFLLCLCLYLSHGNSHQYIRQIAAGKSNQVKTSQHDLGNEEELETVHDVKLDKGGIDVTEKSEKNGVEKPNDKGHEHEHDSKSESESESEKNDEDMEHNEDDSVENAYVEDVDESEASNVSDENKKDTRKIMYKRISRVRRTVFIRQNTANGHNSGSSNYNSTGIMTKGIQPWSVIVPLLFMMVFTFLLKWIEI